MGAIVSFCIKTLTLCHMRVLLQDGCTPLYRAAKNGYDKIVDVLARASADVNAADKVWYFCL
jgi:ankyrin repeat protein